MLIERSDFLRCRHRGALWGLRRDSLHMTVDLGLRGHVRVVRSDADSRRWLRMRHDFQRWKMCVVNLKTERQLRHDDAIHGPG